MSNKIDFQLVLEETIKGLEPIGTNKLWNHLIDFTIRGKKLRSSFVIMLWETYLPKKEIPKKLVNDLIALELIHSSTLIHDDIIDKGLYRRNITTINNEFGEEIALLSGNLVKDLALKISHPQNIPVLNSASFDVNLGQLWETLAREHETISINHYFSITLFKASKIFIYSLDIFSFYSNIKITQTERNYIASMAMLYQIADDLLDHLNPKPIDKSIGQDKKNNVHSFIYATFNEKFNEVAYKDGVHYSEEVLFIRRYLDIIKDKYSFSLRIEELPAEKQVNFLNDLCELLKADAKKEEVNNSIYQVLNVYFEKIVAYVSHL